MDKDYLVLKRASASRPSGDWNDDDYDVVANGAVVGRILKVHAAPVETAKMPFPIHPHMLRHACGFKLANDGHDTRALQHYLGHKNIQHTVRYTDMAPDRFKDFWRD